MRIGELAKSVEVSVETIRCYQRIGLLELPEKPYGGMRSYNEPDLQRLRFIRRANSSDFRLRTLENCWSFRAVIVAELNGLPLKN